MGFLRRLAGGSTDRPMEYRWAANGIAIDSDGVSWEAASSPDGRWAILTRDSNDADDQIGYRTSGPGRYRLVEGSLTRCEGRLLRPNDAKAADNGTFLIADWLFTDELACRVCIFDANGGPIVDETYGANVLATCLSDDGRYGAVHLASNPERPEFDDLVKVWDLVAHAPLWSKQLEGGRARSMVLDSTAKFLRAETDGIGWANYDLTTGMTDVAAIRETVLREGDGFEILDLVQEEVSAGPVEEARARDLIAYCESAASKLHDYPNHEARALRMAGEVAHQHGNPSAALPYWDRALALDPKVGVRARAKALRASLPT